MRNRRFKRIAVVLMASLVMTSGNYSVSADTVSPKDNIEATLPGSVDNEQSDIDSDEPFIEESIEDVEPVIVRNPVAEEPDIISNGTKIALQERMPVSMTNNTDESQTLPETIAEARRKYEQI